MTSYTLDSNVLIWFQRQMARDVFVTPWEALEAAIAAGEVCICDAVLTELERGGDDLHEWAKEQQGFCCLPEAPEFETVSAVGAAHPSWVQDQKNEADPWVVAYGVHHGRTIVSDERPGGPGVAKVPNVADEFGAPCIDRLGWFRAQGWVF